MSNNSTEMQRLEILLERYRRLQGGGIDAGLMSVVNIYGKVAELKRNLNPDLECQLRGAELQLQHAIRGLAHKDYDSVFEGFIRTMPSKEKA